MPVKSSVHGIWVTKGRWIYLRQSNSENLQANSTFSKKLTHNGSSSLPLHYPMSTVISVPIFIFAHIANNTRKTGRTSRSMVEQDIRVGCFTSSGQMGTKVAFPAKAVLRVPTELDSGGLWLPSTETYKPPTQVHSGSHHQWEHWSFSGSKGLTAGTLKHPNLQEEQDSGSRGEISMAGGGGAGVQVLIIPGVTKPWNKSRAHLLALHSTKEKTP